jgi:hypothetical protein
MTQKQSGIAKKQNGIRQIESCLSDRLPTATDLPANGQGLLVIEHRAEIGHVKPAFKEVRMNRGSAMGMAGFVICAEMIN